jgi:hypothetical protein
VTVEQLCRRRLEPRKATEAHDQVNGRILTRKELCVELDQDGARRDLQGRFGVENFDREAAWWRSRCTMPSRMSVTRPSYVPPDRVTPSSSASAARFPTPPRRSGGWRWWRPRCVVHLTARWQAATTAPDRLKWTHVRGSHLTHDPHMRRRRGKPGQGLQRARLHRFTQQCSEGLLDVLQALAVCEVRVRAVPTYNLVRPDGEGFRAAVR